VIGSPQIGWWIAHVAFWVLLALAVRDGRWRVIGVVGTLWIAGYIATRQVE
jgi:hypothetical protein